MYQAQKTINQFFLKKAPIKNSSQNLFLPPGSEHNFPPLDHRVHNINNRLFQDESLSTFFDQFEPQLPSSLSSDHTQMEIESYFEVDLGRIEEEEVKIEVDDNSNVRKVDGRKGKSGRKAKTFDKTISDYLECPNFKNWLRKNIIKTAEGDIQIYFYCEWCKSMNFTNQVANGILFAVNENICSAFNSSRLIDHGKINKKHKLAKDFALQKILQFPQRNIEIKFNSDYTKLYNLLEFLLLVIDKNLSISSISDLSKFIQSKGFIIPKHYLCTTSLSELIRIMAQESQTILVEKIALSEFFSVAIDTSMDITKTKSLSVNILFLDQQIPTWAYLDSIFLENFNAKSIYQGLAKLFNDLGLNYKKSLVGFCSDGDETLRSPNNGVYGLLKRDVSALIGVHCLAHVFNLACKTDLANQFPILNDIFNLVYSTYKYIYASPNRINVLFENQEEIQDLLSEINLIKPMQIRWLSIFKALLRIVRIFPSVINTLKQINDLNSKSLLAWYSLPRYLAWVHFLADIGPDFQITITSFQDKNLSIKKAIGLVISAKNNVKRKYIDDFKPGHYYSQFLKKVKWENNIYMYDNSLQLTQAIEIDVYQIEFKQFAEYFQKFIDERFENLYRLIAFEYFGLNFLKNSINQERIVEEFQTKIPLLLNECKFENKFEEVIAEFPFIWDFIKTNYTETDDPNIIYRELIAFFKNQFPLFIELLGIYRVIPLTSVECERTFSEANRNKTKFRASMGDGMLKYLLQLGINPRQTFKKDMLLKRSILRWKNEKERIFLQPQIPEDADNEF